MLIIKLHSAAFRFCLDSLYIFFKEGPQFFVVTKVLENSSCIPRAIWYNTCMTQKRTTLLYGNCQVFSPQGKLMFRCHEKRAKWYLKRDLAEVVGEDPLSIKLNFQPKGNGETNDLLLIEKENKCVVCGDTNLSRLTKHHIIPVEYRKWFPTETKSRSSVYLVPICREDHSYYEDNHARDLKVKLSKVYDAPLLPQVPKEHFAIRKLNSLIEHSDVIPKDRMHIIKSGIIKTIGEACEYDHDLSDPEAMKLLVKELRAIKKEGNSAHGQIVMGKVIAGDDLSKFVSMWVHNFFYYMTPEYIDPNLEKYLTGK